MTPDSTQEAIPLDPAGAAAAPAGESAPPWRLEHGRLTLEVLDDRARLVGGDRELDLTPATLRWLVLTAGPAAVVALERR